MDGAGLGDSESQTITVGNRPPHSVNAGPDRTAPLGIGVSFNSSVDAADPLTPQWEFGDGSAPSFSVNQFFSRAWYALGTYTVTLSIMDDDGAVSVASHTMSVVPPVAPSPGFIPNGSAPSETVSLVDLPTLTFRWDFGDGQTATAQPTQNRGEVVPIYTASGTYPVKVTVTDKDGGTATTTSNIVITTP